MRSSQTVTRTGSSRTQREISPRRFVERRTGSSQWHRQCRCVIPSTAPSSRATARDLSPSASQGRASPARTQRSQGFGSSGRLQQPRQRAHPPRAGVRQQRERFLAALGMTKVGALGMTENARDSSASPRNDGGDRNDEECALTIPSSRAERGISLREHSGLSDQPSGYGGVRMGVPARRVPRRSPIAWGPVA